MSYQKQLNIKKMKTNAIKLSEINNKFGEDVHAAINWIKQQNFVERPVKPKKPVLLSPHTISDVREYAIKLEQWEKDHETYEKEKNHYQFEEHKINTLIVDYIKEKAGLDTIPLQYRDKVYSKAYDDGHSDGYYEVYLKLCSLIEIF